MGLQVLGKRIDGYHDINSIFIELQFHDIISFKPSKTYSLATNNLALPIDKTNLVYKAYKALKPYKHQNLEEYSIYIDKKIPMGGGLGGGSSNAGTTLKVLNKLWNCKLDNDALIDISSSLGADVPFFIKGGIQIVGGIGDKLESINFNEINKFQFLLITPEIHISTKWAYENLNINLQSSINRANFSPLKGPVNWQLFENDFERVIRSTYPEIDEIKSQLYSLGAVYAGMSGSGSTVFGIFDNRKLLQPLSEKFTQCQSFITSPNTK